MYYLFWTTLTVVMLLWYTITVAKVSVYGYRDLKKMFSELHKNLKTD